MDGRPDLFKMLDHESSECVIRQDLLVHEEGSMDKLLGEELNHFSRIPLLHVGDDTLGEYQCR